MARRDPRGRRRLALLAGAAVIAAGAGIAVGARDENRSSVPGPQSPVPRSENSGLPLRAAVGQLLVSSFDGAELPQYLRRRLRAGETAGVVLFGRNVASPAGLRDLTRTAQRAAAASALVAVDQEGGPVRIVPFVGPQQAQPAQADPVTTRLAAREAARGLRSFGVTVTLAPVADVAAGPAAVMSGRAFPGESAAVARLTAAAVRGWRQGRVAPTVKHFPGFGSAARNTDDEPVTISRSRASLAADLRPFGAAIAAGTPLVMASHAVYSAYDPGRIASQSPVLLDELLRRRLRFRGAVMTDSLEAEAVLRRSSVAVAAERAIAAGADIVLMTGSASWNEVFPRLLRRAQASAAFRRRVERSAARVLALKRRLGLRAPR